MQENVRYGQHLLAVVIVLVCAGLDCVGANWLGSAAAPAETPAR